MTVQFSSHQSGIIKLGLSVLALGAFGACIFKDKISSAVRSIWQTTPSTQIQKSLSGRIDASKKNKHLDKLCLVFDINKTIIGDDTTKKSRTPEQTTIVALAQSVIAVWDNQYEAMSFEHYVNSILVPASKYPNLDQLKEQRLKVIFGFINWLYEKNHPAKEIVLKKYNQIMEKITDPITKQINYRVFESFYTLLEKLRKCHVNFTVVLMTFGDDLRRVAEEIGKHHSGVDFRRYGEFHSKQLQLSDGTTLAKADDIFQAFMLSDHHYALKANYKEWHQDRESGRSGKPFIYDSTGEMHGIRNLSLFFDDNITHGNEKDIIAPIDIAGTTVQNIDLTSQLIKVDPVEAQIDPKYYVKMTIQSLQEQGHKELAEQLIRA